MNNSLNKEFKNLKNNIKPRSEWVTSNKVLLLNQIKSATKEQVSFVDYFNALIGAFRNQFMEPAVVMLLVLATFLGSSLTINAAFYSLPGDNLYNVKLALEKTHVALVQDNERRVELKMEFAQKRISEFDKIFASADTTSEEKKKQIETVVRELKNNVASVSNDLRRIKSTEDNKDGSSDQVRMAVTVSSQSKDLVKEIDEKISQLPEEEKQQFQVIVAEALASVNEVNQSAQQLAEGISDETEEIVDLAEEVEEVTTEPPVTDETEPNNTQASEDDISDETASDEKTLE